MPILFEHKKFINQLDVAKNQINNKPRNHNTLDSQTTELQKIHNKNSQKKVCLEYLTTCSEYLYDCSGRKKSVRLVGGHQNPPTIYKNFRLIGLTDPQHCEQQMGSVNFSVGGININRYYPAQKKLLEQFTDYKDHDFIPNKLTYSDDKLTYEYSDKVMNGYQLPIDYSFDECDIYCRFHDSRLDFEFKVGCPNLTFEYDIYQVNLEVYNGAGDYINPSYFTNANPSNTNHCGELDLSRIIYQTQFTVSESLGVSHSKIFLPFSCCILGLQIEIYNADDSYKLI